MIFRNEDGELIHIADNLTLKEVQEMGFTIDLCDDEFNPSEHWSNEASSE